MSRTLPEKAEIVVRWFRDNIFDRAGCAPQLPDFTLPPLSTPPAHSSPSPANALRLFSYNTWGLPIAPLCSRRIAHLSTLFHAYDVIALQEMSTNRDVHTLTSLARAHGFPHAHQFGQGVGFPVWNGVTAPGLLVLSRFAIVDVGLWRYRVSGLLYRFDHSDWVAGKGVGLVRVDVTERCTSWKPGDERVIVDVFLTHLHANYSNYYFNYATAYSAALTSALPLCPIPCPDFYLPHRVAQAFDLARYYLTQRHPTHLATLSGDLNAAPYDIVLHLIQAMTGLRDAWLDEGGGGAGYTCGAHDNTYSRYAEAVARGEREEEVRKRHGMDGRANGVGVKEEHSRDVLHETPKRIDYILYATPTHTAVAPPTLSLLPCVPPVSTPLAATAPSPASLTSCVLVKPTMQHAGRTVSLSDHHAVSATFSLTSPSRPRQLGGMTLDLSPRSNPSRRLEQKEAAQPTQPTPPLSAILTVAVRIITAGVAETHARRRMQWLAAALAVLFFILLTYTSFLTPNGFLASTLTALLHYPLTLFSRPLTLLSSLFSASAPAPPVHPVARAVVLLVLGVCGVVRWLLPLVGLLVFLLAQFPAKEEEIALMETLQEMKLYLAHVKRAEEEQELLATRNKRSVQAPIAIKPLTGNS